MKKIFTSTLISIISITSLNAAKTEIGYCNGNVSETTVGKVGKSDISASIILSEDMLEDFIGTKVTGIRLYLSNVNGLSDLRGWVKESLEGEDLISGTKDEAITGWQTIPMNGSFTIDGKPLAIGYTFSQTSNVKTITFGGEFNSQGHYIAKNGEWELAKITKTDGSICVELELEGESIPEKDVKVLSAKLPLTAKGESFSGKMTLKNISLNPVEISGYKVQIGDYSEQIALDNNLIINPKAKSVLPIRFSSADVPGDTPVNCNISLISENDGKVENNSISCLTGCYETSYPHNLLLEEFTTEQCVNCPRAINTIAQAMENGYDKYMTVVCHHVGFYTDWLTLEEDKDLLWLYGDDGSFAPAVMLDRTIRNDDLDTPVESIAYYDTFKDRLDEALINPSFVGVDVEPVFNSDGKIEVSVKAEAHPLFATLCDSPRLTVLVIEDGIKHMNQAGINNPDFTHSHVTRAYLTPVDGLPFNWDENNFEWKGEIELNDWWVPANLEVVAFINRYDSKDATSCNVYNSAARHIGEAGIDSIISDNEIKSTEYFTLDGRKVSNPDSGIFIVKETDNNGKINARKIIL